MPDQIKRSVKKEGVDTKLMYHIMPVCDACGGVLCCRRMSENVAPARRSQRRKKK